MTIAVAAFNRQEHITREMALANVLSLIGPPIAMGRPDERLSPGGFARFYVPPELVWIDVVEDSVRHAALVVIRAGLTGGIMREVQVALGRCAPLQLLIYCADDGHGGKEQCYRRFRAATQDYFKIPLPETIGRAHYICFDEDWTPVVLEPDGMHWWTWFRLSYKRRVADLKAHSSALRPMFERHGIEWEEPKLGCISTLTVVLGVIGLAVLLGWLVYFLIDLLVHY